MRIVKMRIVDPGIGGLNFAFSFAVPDSVLRSLLPFLLYIIVLFP
jgi:hypothetical protein